MTAGALAQGPGIPLPVPKATLREEAAKAAAEAEKKAAALRVSCPDDFSIVSYDAALQAQCIHTLQLVERPRAGLS